jgi:hypothetical protein
LSEFVAPTSSRISLLGPCRDDLVSTELGSKFGTLQNSRTPRFWLFGPVGAVTASVRA